jgi:hypothetical protein
MFSLFVISLWVVLTVPKEESPTLKKMLWLNVSLWLAISIQESLGATTLKWLLWSATILSGVLLVWIVRLITRNYSHSYITDVPQTFTYLPNWGEFTRGLQRDDISIQEIVLANQVFRGCVKPEQKHCWQKEGF